MLLSVIITSYNEGKWVASTIESVRSNTNDCEIILVDDGSTDESCIGTAANKLIRHDSRIGIAYSRSEAAANAKGDCLAFLDAHQDVSEGCLNQCAEIAIEQQAIVYPDVIGYVHLDRILHGAHLIQRGGEKAGILDGTWIRKPPHDRLSRISTAITPGYVIPRSVFAPVRWADGLRGFGGSEPAVMVRAFFADVHVLHLCGPFVHHLFKGKGGANYSSTWEQEACNHAITVRVCFTDKTWRNYWIPRVFSRWLSADALSWYDGPIALQQHREFHEKYKRRPDSEFWRGLLQNPVPDGVSDE